MAEFTVAVPGGSLSVDEDGAGDLVLLLHAGVTDRRVWDATVSALVAAGYRVARFDCRGFGRSPASEVPFSQVADALAVLDALGVESAHLVGLSQGAATSVDVALTAPARARTLALIAPGLSGYEFPRLPGYERRLAAAERDDAPALALEIARLWAPLSFDGAVTLLPGDVLPGDVLPGDLAARIVLDHEDAFMADELDESEPDPRPRLAEISVPTLVVLGAQDLDAIADVGRLLAAEIAGARLITLDGADHLLPLRVPEQLHKVLTAHLGS